MITEIAEHSVDLSLLPLKANILDIGCRGFWFKDYFTSLNHNVIALDIDELPRGDYRKIAISDVDGFCSMVNTSDPQARHIKTGNDIPMFTLDSLSKLCYIDKWDLIKIDIEGEEVKVLKSISHPYCKQISVEFHAHCGVQTKEQLDSLLDWLSEWYTIHNKVWEQRHGCSFNYWDILLIAK